MPAHIDYGARVRIWDHPKTADRYTILPPRTAGDDSRDGIEHGRLAGVGAGDENGAGHAWPQISRSAA